MDGYRCRQVQLCPLTSYSTSKTFPCRDDEAVSVRPKVAPKRVGAAERANCGVAARDNKDEAGLDSGRENARANTILTEAEVHREREQRKEGVRRLAEMVFVFVFVFVFVVLPLLGRGELLQIGDPGLWRVRQNRKVERGYRLGRPASNFRSQQSDAKEKGCSRVGCTIEGLLAAVCCLFTF